MIGRWTTTMALAVALALGCGGGDDGGQAADEGEAPAGEATPSDGPAPTDGATADLGPARGDLARFHGRYADPQRERESRVFWVAEDCDGRLIAGAMWGDAAPWRMRSIGETTFEQRQSPREREFYEPVRLEFAVDEAGEVTGATMRDWEGVEQRLDRIDDLPAEWVDGWECPM